MVTFCCLHETTRKSETGPLLMCFWSEVLAGSLTLRAKSWFQELLSYLTWAGLFAGNQDLWTQGQMHFNWNTHTAPKTFPLLTGTRNSWSSKARVCFLDNRNRASRVATGHSIKEQKSASLQTDTETSETKELWDHSTLTVDTEVQTSLTDAVKH